MGRGEKRYILVLQCWHGGASGEGFKSNLDSFQWTLTHGNYKVEPSDGHQLTKPVN